MNDHIKSVFEKPILYLTAFGAIKAGKVVCTLTNEQRKLQDAMQDVRKTC